MKTMLRFLSAVIGCAVISAPLAAQSDDPPSRVARLSFLNGNVSFQASGESQWNQASQNFPLSSGDRLYTDKGGEAEFESGNVAIRLSGDTDVSVTNLSDNLIQLGLAEGVVRLHAYSIISGNSIEVDTPNAALTLLRDGNYRIEAYPNDNTTLVVVNSGDLEISGDGIDRTLHSGQAARLTGDNPAELVSVDPPGSDGFDTWCNDRDRRFANSPSRQYVGEDMPGYYDLDQYGSWLPVAQYGPVWYPAGVSADWVPYRYGRWAWVDPWGWTWIEEEPWGFAPFHYGRWVFVGSRWGWIPGEPVVRPVYAPALVAFVGGGLSVSISAGPPVAWFPLGPREPYFPWYHHSDDYVRRVNVTNVRNVTNITNIINVTNVRDIRYVNRTVATTAVSPDTFRRGELVERQVVRVDRDQMARAQVIPHPEVMPEARAIAAGAAQTHPQVENRRAAIVYRRPGGGSEQPVRAEAQVPPPSRPPEQSIRAEAPTPPLSRPPEQGRGNAVESAGRNIPKAENQYVEPSRPQPPQPSAEPARNQHPLYTRNSPPPEKPAFEQRQPAIAQHPGRPLEPQQMQNLREGKPAGSQRDPEFPQHVQAAERGRPKSEPPRH